MVNVIDIDGLQKTVQELLGHEEYNVEKEDPGIPELIIYPTFFEAPDIARVKYTPDFQRIIIEELENSHPTKMSKEEHLKFLEEHRPKLQNMAVDLEIKSQRERRPINVIYINYHY